jgi:WD40 repeat protein
VIFHPAGGKLITSGSQGVYVWPIRWHQKIGGWQIGPPEQLDLPVGTAALSADGRFLSVAHDGHDEAVVVAFERPEEPIVLGEHARLNCAAISPDGQWVATGTWHGSGVKVWDAVNGKLVKEFATRTSARCSFSPDGKWLVVTTGQEYVFREVGSWRDGHRVSREGAGDVPGRLAFSPDGEVVAVAHSRSRVQLIESATGAELANLEPPYPGEVSGLCFSPDGSVLAVGTSNHFLRLWDLRRIRERLARMGLDWHLPPYPPAGRLESSEPLRIHVEITSD